MTSFQSSEFVLVLLKHGFGSRRIWLYMTCQSFDPSLRCFPRPSCYFLNLLFTASSVVLHLCFCCLPKPRPGENTLRSSSAGRSDLCESRKERNLAVGQSDQGWLEKSAVFMIPSYNTVICCFHDPRDLLEAWLQKISFPQLLTGRAPSLACLSANQKYFAIGTAFSFKGNSWTPSPGNNNHQQWQYISADGNVLLGWVARWENGEERLSKSVKLCATEMQDGLVENQTVGFCLFSRDDQFPALNKAKTNDANLLSGWELMSWVHTEYLFCIIFHLLEKSDIRPSTISQ